MAVLLLYNDSLEWTVEQIQDKTQIKIELLLSVLISLFQSKLLTCNELNEENVTEINIKMNSIIKLSSNFKRYSADWIFDITGYLVSAENVVWICMCHSN
jgi:cullin 1